MITGEHRQVLRGCYRGQQLGAPRALGAMWWPGQRQILVEGAQLLDGFLQTWGTWGTFPHQMVKLG